MVWYGRAIMFLAGLNKARAMVWYGMAEPTMFLAGLNKAEPNARRLRLCLR